MKPKTKKVLLALGSWLTCFLSMFLGLCLLEIGGIIVLALTLLNISGNVSQLIEGYFYVVSGVALIVIPIVLAIRQAVKGAKFYGLN